MATVVVGKWKSGISRHWTVMVLAARGVEIMCVSNKLGIRDRKPPSLIDQSCWKIQKCLAYDEGPSGLGMWEMEEAEEKSLVTVQVQNGRPCRCCAVVGCHSGKHCSWKEVPTTFDEATAKWKGLGKAQPQRKKME